MAAPAVGAHGVDGDEEEDFKYYGAELFVTKHSYWACGPDVVCQG